MGMNFYFAYGSNMLQIQMKERCPDSEYLERAYIKGYKLVFDGYSTTWRGAVANIVEDEKEIVWGGLYKINKNDLKLLDRYEGFPNSYNRKKVNVNLDDGEIIEAIVYFRIGKSSSSPSFEYREIVIIGAKQWMLPIKYIKKFIEEIDNFEEVG